MFVTLVINQRCACKLEVDTNLRKGLKVSALNSAYFILVPMFVLLSHTSSFIPNTILSSYPPTPATLDRRDLSKIFSQEAFFATQKTNGWWIKSGIYSFVLYFRWCAIDLFTPRWQCLRWEASLTQFSAQGCQVAWLGFNIAQAQWLHVSFVFCLKPGRAATWQ